MNQTDLYEMIEQFILANLVKNVERGVLTPTTRLVSSGMLDSLAITELVMFLEDRLHVSFEAHELDASKLDTLEDLVRLVSAKLG